ncbi:N-acetyltransferase [Xanthomonas sp. AmX2]|uniref:GNAT family N-acetyltransferase n=1 Tax=Xanthomonas sp. TaxID=29446 RepID=UPI0019809AEC|nr:GNAT family N-acetyltransferase [Xanthomonas sp.]MBN6148828.1 N-acetyltransferase [Xanthomonas sp.]
MNPSSAPLIHHDPQQKRFALTLDGHEAELGYVREPGRLIITHTGVPGPLEGRGLAAALVAAALDHARAEGLKVVPACSYAAAYLQRHPEYAGLLE